MTGSEPAPSPDRPDERHELGVLLVHGIGEQSQGETLVKGCEPIIDWVRAWLWRETPDARFVAATPMVAGLRSPLAMNDTPAHATVLLGRQQGKDEQAQNWLFAEAHWATQVMAPPLVDFTVWLLTRGAWMLIFHLDRNLVRRPVWQQALLWPPMALSWMAASLTTNIVLLCSALLALVPIGRLRQAVYGLLRGLAGVIGDAYVLINHPVQRTAFENATLRSLHWLHARCQRVAVVAHSQGAAIAHGALQRPDAPPTDAFVTVGSGIAKLYALRWFERQTPLDRAAALLAPPLILLALWVGLRTRQLGLTDVATLWLGPGMLLVVGIGLLAAAWMLARNARAWLRRSSSSLDLHDAHPNLKWCDMAGSHDPVSAGTLNDYFDAARVQCEPLLPVLRSWVSDHTSYWQAKASFLPLLVRRLAECAQAHFLGLDPADGRFAHASRRLDRNLRVLRWMRGFDAAAVLVPLVWAAPRLQQQTQDWRDRLQGGGRGPVAFVDAALTKVEEALAWGIEQIASTPDAEEVHRLVNVAAAVLLWGLLLWLWQRLAFVVWQLWSDNNLESAWRPVKQATEPRRLRERLEEWASDTLTEAGLTLVLVLPFALSIVWTLGPASWLSEGGFYTLLGAVASTLLAAALVFALVSDWAESIDGASWRQALMQKLQFWRR